MKVIFKKGTKIVELPYFVWSSFNKVRGLYFRKDGAVVFDEEVNEIIFNDVDFKHSIEFELLKYQELDFIRCNFDSISVDLKNGNCGIYSCDFNGTDLSVLNGDSVDFHFEQDAILKYLI